MDLTKRGLCKLHNFNHEQNEDKSYLYKQASTINIKTNESQVTDAHNLTNM